VASFTTRWDIDRIEIRIEAVCTALFGEFMLVEAIEMARGQLRAHSIEIVAARHPRLKLNGLRLNVYLRRSMTMSTKTNIAAAAALLTALAAPKYLSRKQRPI
jgi:hypothetical protein